MITHVARCLCVFSLVVLFVSSEDSTTVSSNVITLTDANIHLTKRGQWLIDFYAPWCGHCKKLAPVYEQVANHFAKDENKRDEIVNIAKVDCDAFSGICSAAGVSGYPTIKYFVDGTPKVYRGGRQLKDFVDYIDKMSKSPVTKLASSSLGKLIKQDQVSFILVTHPGDTEVELLFEKAAKTLQDFNAPEFFFSDDIKAFEKGLGRTLTLPTILTAQSGDVQLYPGKFKLDTVVTWMVANQFPYISQFTENTYEQLTSQPKKLVIAAADPSDPTTKQFTEQLTIVSKNNQLDFLFSVIDGAHFAKWLTNYGVDGPHMPTLLVLDESHDQYYTDLDTKFSGTKPMEKFLEDIRNGELKPKVTSYVTYYSNKISKVLVSFQALIMENPVVSLAAGGIILSLLLYACFAGGETAKPPYTPTQAPIKSAPATKKSENKKVDKAE